MATSTSYKRTLSNIAALRAYTGTITSPFAVEVLGNPTIGSNIASYLWYPNSTTPDNGDTVIKLASREVGRFLKYDKANVSGMEISSNLSQLIDIDSLKAYKGTAKILFVADNLQGGQFKRYTGTDPVDNGMIFMDADNAKWLRVTNDSKIRIGWYGIKPYNNHGGWNGQTGTDDAITIRKAVSYIKSHRDLFDVLKFDLCEPNEWYHIGSTVDIGGISIEGEGQWRAPKTRFSVAPYTTAFVIPAGSHNYCNVSNISIASTFDYGYIKPNTFKHHCFEIHTVVEFNNVHVTYNPNGDGFHLDACGYADPSDIENFGNADSSIFNRCQADACIRGFFIEGCDANVINFIDCSATSCMRWGIYDNGLLGNKYYNLHLANNGKTHETGVYLNHGKVGDPDFVEKASTWFLRADVDKDNKPINSIGKRPDLHPELWYQNDTGLGEVELWNPTKQYYSGGGVWAANENAKNSFIGTYTESFSPANIIGSRSTWSAGLDGALVIGGIQENVYGNFKFFRTGHGYGIPDSGGIHAPIVAAKKFRLQTTSKINPAAEIDISADTDGSKEFLLPKESGRLVTDAVIMLPGEPTTKDVPEWTFRVYYNMAIGKAFVYANLGGTIKKTELF